MKFAITFSKYLFLSNLSITLNAERKLLKITLKDSEKSVSFYSGDENYIQGSIHTVSSVPYEKLFRRARLWPLSFHKKKHSTFLYND